MKRLTALVCAALILAIPFAAAEAGNPSTSDTPAQQSLFSTVSKLDTDFFDSFNHCASPEQLQKHASYLVPNLEFYHDKGGVTWSRADYLANTPRVARSAS